MGEIADSMVYGECCEMCGAYLGGESPGYPRYCSLSCAEDRGAGIEQVVPQDEQYGDLYDEDTPHE